MFSKIPVSNGPLEYLFYRARNPSFKESDMIFDLNCEYLNLVSRIWNTNCQKLKITLTYFLLYLDWCVKWEKVAQSCLTLCNPMDYTVYGISLGQNTRVGSLSLLQGIFPTQGLNPGLSCCRQILYQLSHQGSPGVLQWVAYPFSSRSSQPRSQTGVSCIAGRFFTNWAIMEALKYPWNSPGQNTGVGTLSLL